MRLLESALRTAIAREETLRLMTPSQRDAFKRLQDQVGGAVEIRLRPGAGTPRVIALPKTVRSAKPAVVVVADPFATAYAFLATNRDLLLLADPEQELRVARQETDDLHLTHVRFSQMYQGLNVWPAELIVHLNLDREVNLLNGAFVPTPKEVPTTPTVDSDGAVAAARTAAPGGADAKSGAPTLMIYAPGDKPARLAWKVELDIAADSRWLVVIDALDGSTLNAFNQVMEENAVGSGVDLLNATRPMNVWHGNNQYYLVDTSKPMFDPASTPPANPKGAIVIVDANHQTLPSNGDMTCDQITSSSPTSGWMQDGVSAAFGLSQTYDYYQTRHNRNSIDGQGGTMTGIVRYSQNFKNAFWNGQAMFFGDALPYAAALDTVAHELTHGVTGHTANLLYQDQSGAMNEAFSDIFGEMVEAFVKGTNDWQLGEDMNHIMRCMSDPSSLEIMPGHPFPSKMSEYLGPDDPVLDNFQNRDSGGVHINSLIISHAYFLLAAGMEGALPPTKAASIFYRALTTHLVSQSQFLDGRIACIQAAKELFGDASAEATKTEQAFDGVEIFDGAGQPPQRRPRP